MKFKAPSTTWTKTFAWWPVRMTTGENDACRVIWLESYAIRLQSGMSGPSVFRMSLRDAECHRHEWERIRKEIDDEDRIG